MLSKIVKKIKGHQVRLEAAVQNVSSKWVITIEKNRKHDKEAHTGK